MASFLGKMGFFAVFGPFSQTGSQIHVFCVFCGFCTNVFLGASLDFRSFTSFFAVFAS